MGCPTKKLGAPPGLTPFDHTSIIATLGKLFGIKPLTARDDAAPNVVDPLEVLGRRPDNDGLASITAPAAPPTPGQLAQTAARSPTACKRA